LSKKKGFIRFRMKPFRFDRIKNLTAARMTAITGNFGHVLFFRRLALRTAIFLVISDRARARFMSAFIVFVCHKSKSSLES
jgi:hypothetical protein